MKNLVASISVFIACLTAGASAHAAEAYLYFCEMTGANHDKVVHCAYVLRESEETIVAGENIYTKLVYRPLVFKSIKVDNKLCSYERTDTYLKDSKGDTVIQNGHRVAATVKMTEANGLSLTRDVSKIQRVILSTNLRMTYYDQPTDFYDRAIRSNVAIFPDIFAGRMVKSSDYYSVYSYVSDASCVVNNVVVNP